MLVVGPEGYARHPWKASPCYVNGASTDADFYQKVIIGSAAKRRRGIGCGTEIAGSVGVFLEEIKMALGGFEELLIEENQKADPKRTGFRIGSSGGTRTPDPAVNSRLLYQLSYRGSSRFGRITSDVPCFHP